MSSKTLQSFESAFRPRLRAARSNFGRLIALLPPPRRRALTVLYLFCRAVDDCADAPDASLPDRLEGLDLWETAIRSGQHPADPQLAQAVALLRQQHDIPEDCLLAIIAGCRDDLRAPFVHPPRDRLDRYCDRVAGAVGAVILRLCHGRSAALADLAQQAGRAMQYTNILRDLDEDAGRGRVYLPSDLLPTGPTTPEEQTRACERLAAEAMGLYQRCTAILHTLPAPERRAITPAVVFIDCYRLLLLRLTTRGFSPAARRVPPTLPVWQMTGPMLRLVGHWAHREGWR